MAGPEVGSSVDRPNSNDASSADEGRRASSSPLIGQDTVISKRRPAASSTPSPGAIAAQVRAGALRPAALGEKLVGGTLGHFALEEDGHHIADLMREFLGRQLAGSSR